MSRKPVIEPYHQSPSSTLYCGDVLDVLRSMDSNSVDMIFADPPYMLSNGGVTCQSGRMVSVNKGDWDASRGVETDYAWHKSWLKACRRVLNGDGTIWVSGTYHNIYLIGHAMQSLGFRVLNDVAWIKPNAAPNLGCRCFTHSHETILWASKSPQSVHTFNYQVMKEENLGKQMRSFWGLGANDSWHEDPPDVWEYTSPKRPEKSHGKHPTQKPLALMERIVNSSTREGDLVLDPFVGSGTTGVAALTLGRCFVGIDASEEYLKLAVARMGQVQGRLP